MFLKYCILGICGLSFGIMVSSGIFTVLAAVGLIPRFAGRTRTTEKIMRYETHVVLGTIIGSLFSVFEWPVLLNSFYQMAFFESEFWKWCSYHIVILYGLFAGVFVGCLALALAALLDSIPIFARRVNFKQGIGIAMISFADGKIVGSILYFYFNFYLFGGV